LKSEKISFILFLWTNSHLCHGCKPDDTIGVSVDVQQSLLEWV
jgi:hypothetical protein